MLGAVSVATMCYTSGMKKSIHFRLAESSLTLLDECAQMWGQTRTGMLEMLIRRFAFEQRTKVMTSPDVYERYEEHLAAEVKRQRTEQGRAE